MGECRVSRHPCDGHRLPINLRRHLFDTLYHATAMHTEGATLITADDSYYAKARRRRRIMRLQDLKEDPAMPCD